MLEDLAKYRFDEPFFVFVTHGQFPRILIGLGKPVTNTRDSEKLGGRIV